jgi:hypothetical protein
MRTSSVCAKWPLPLVVALSLLLPPAIGNAAPVSSATTGKKSIFVAEESGVTVDFGDVPPLTGTIAKAKSGILAIEGQITFLSDATAGTTGVYQQLLINGFALNAIHPFSVPGPEVNCGTGHSECTITATYWVDLDAAELEAPGLVLNQPLVITFRGGVLTGPAVVNYRASFSARLEKR